jgi:hypothetical protein
LEFEKGMTPKIQAKASPMFCLFDAHISSLSSLQLFSNKTCHLLRQQNPKPAWHKTWHPP